MRVASRDWWASRLQQGKGGKVPRVVSGLRCMIYTVDMVVEVYKACSMAL
jgi:hypothetical protein